jgi:hypothetical protein
MLEIEQAQDGIGRSGRVFPSIADDRVRSKGHEELTSAGQAWRHSTRFETALHPMDLWPWKEYLLMRDLRAVK